MGKEFILDDSPSRTQWVRPDATGFTVRTRFKNTDQILDRNKAARADTPKRFGDGTMHHVASVPMEVYDQWVLEWRQAHPTEGLGEEFNQFVAAKLRDPDFSYLKTREARL